MKAIIQRIAMWQWVTHYQLEEHRTYARKHRRYFRWWIASGLLILMGGAP